MGTPEFSLPALRAVAGAHQVVAVYTQPDRPVGRGLEVRYSPVKQAALDLGLPVFQPEKLSDVGEIEKLRALQADVMVVVAYGQILKRAVIEMPRLGCINIHSSLLPRWRGAAPIQRAMLAGDAETGVTTMLIAEKLDAGDILLQKHTPIAADETAQTLHDRLASLGGELILPTLAGRADGSLQAQKQDEAKVTYAAKLTKELERLNPVGSDAASLDRQVRALNPWPGTSVTLTTGERLKIKRAALRRDVTGGAGTLFEKQGQVFLGASDGALELVRVQWDGKKEVDSSAFLNGIRGAGLKLPLQLA